MFKIVQNIEGRYYSSNPLTEHIYSFLKDGRAIEYKIGELVYPKLNHTQLFCIEDKEAALDIVEGLWYELFECEVISPSKKGYCPYWGGLNLKHYQKCAGQVIVDPELEKHYPSAIFADAVKLVKRIL